MEILTVKKLRDTLGDVISRVGFGREVVAVTRNGRCLLKLMPISAAERAQIENESPKVAEVAT
jgi:prevent-host-death family protein